MIIFVIVIPFIYIKINKYTFKSMFMAYDLYPLFIVELVHIFFQINIFFENYDYVKYANLIQMLFIITLLIPILYRKLYYPSIFGAVFTVLGTFFNKIVMNCNNGKMPVYPTFSRMIGFCTSSKLDGSVDNVHILMNSNTKMNFLGDYIDIGLCVMSIGDILIHSFVSIIICFTIKNINLTKDVRKD